MPERLSRRRFLYAMVCLAGAVSCARPTEVYTEALVIPDNVSSDTVLGQREGKDPNLLRWAKIIENDRRDISYQAMLSPKNRVLILGEDHRMDVVKTEITSNLAIFKSLGFTHLGLEALGTDVTIPKVFNPSKISTREQAVALIEMAIHLQQYRYTPNSMTLYYYMIRGASEIGLNVIGINLPTTEQLAILSSGNTKAELARINDVHMAESVGAILNRDPENKIVALVGGVHADKKAFSGKTMAGILLDRGYEPISINYIGGDNTPDGRHKDGSKSMLERAAFVDGRSYAERFLLPFQTKFPKELTPYDWIIHLPQTE